MMPIDEISVKKMDNDKRKWRGKHPKRKQRYCCKECGYQSDRRFNVERHTKRMHNKCISKECCHILFLKKSDYYQHIEDYHPDMRASCFVSRKKYKIYGRKLKLSTGFSYKTKFENIVNSNNASDVCTAMRKSMRIQKQVVKKEKLSPKETLNEPKCDEYDDNEMDVDYCDHHEHKELIHNLDNYQRMNSLSLVSQEHENSRYEESENNGDSNNNNYCQNNIFHDIKYTQEKYMNNSQNNIQCTESSSSCLEELSSENNIEEYQQVLNDSKHQKLNSNMIKDKNMSQSLLIDTEINVKENLNTTFRLPLKKRILHEINNNIDNNSIPNNKEMKIKKTLFNDKENQNPINIFLNEYQRVTIVKQILTVKQVIQMWDNITQHQRDYLRYIDFNSF